MCDWTRARVCVRWCMSVRELVTTCVRECLRAACVVRLCVCVGMMHVGALLCA